MHFQIKSLSVSQLRNKKRYSKLYQNVVKVVNQTPPYFPGSRLDHIFKHIFGIRTKNYIKKKVT